MRKPITVLAVAGAAVAVLLAGCGGGDNGNHVASVSSPNPTTSPAPAGGGDAGSGDDTDKQRAYAKCMRDNGFDMKDPDPNSMDSVPAIKADDPKFTSANDKCKHLLPNGGEPKPEDPAQLDKQRKWAQCMREHGVDIKDPQPGQAMGLPDGGDPKVQAAGKACASVAG